MIDQNINVIFVIDCIVQSAIPMCKTSFSLENQTSCQLSQVSVYHDSTSARVWIPATERQQFNSWISKAIAKQDKISAIGNSILNVHKVGMCSSLLVTIDSPTSATAEAQLCCLSCLCIWFARRCCECKNRASPPIPAKNGRDRVNSLHISIFLKKIKPNWYPAMKHRKLWSLSMTSQICPNWPPNDV